MSNSGSSPRGRREVAYRVFAAEYDDATFSYAESDEERAPSYVVTPTGARANRLFLTGVLTSVEPAGESNLRARVVDPTGAFVVYAGQYEPDAVSTFELLETPAYLAVTGKARTFESREGGRVFSTVRPETVAEIVAETRDSWVVTTAEQTLARVTRFLAALDRPERGDELRRALLEAGVPPAHAAGIPRAINAYGTTPSYLAAVQRLALDAVRVVAGEREEVRPLSLEPDETDPEFTPMDIDISSSERVGPENEELAAATEAETIEEPSAEPPSADTAPAAPTEPETSTASPESEPEAMDELYEIDDAERESVKEEFDIEFSSGEDIPDAGEADIEPESGSVEEPTTGGEPSDAEAADENAPADLEDAVVERMRELASAGDGTADRGTLVQEMVTEQAVDRAAVEDAIQAALMSGRCYESGDGELTPI